jgi:hypothetical protein
MRLTYLLSLILTTALAVSCGSAPQNTRNASNATAGAGSSPQPAGTPAAGSGRSESQSCYELDTGKKKVLRSQTFPIDFEPFKDTCFVTTHDPDFTDPPLESEIAIYGDGKRVFLFPDQFNGIQTGCWVRAVAFEDINGDRLTDVIVVGKCGAKTGEFNANTVYLNNGKSFFTRTDANINLDGLDSIKKIQEYIKENPRDFSLITDAAPSSN